MPDQTDKKQYVIEPSQKKRVLKFLLISIILLVLFFVGWELAPNANHYDGIVITLLAFLSLVPAFITNAMMPIVANIPGIKRYPIDGGRMHKDGQRILGEGKSWNGLILGTLAGFALSVLIAHLVYDKMYQMTLTNFSDGETVLEYVKQEDILSILDINNDKTRLYTALFLISLSTPIGDILGSYYKRRRKVGRGEAFLFWDQNDFIILGGIVAWIFYPFNWYYFIILLLMTPILTLTFSCIGYFCKIKTHPW